MAVFLQLFLSDGFLGDEVLSLAPSETDDVIIVNSVCEQNQRKHLPQRRVRETPNPSQRNTINTSCVFPSLQSLTPQPRDVTTSRSLTPDRAPIAASQTSHAQSVTSPPQVRHAKPQAQRHFTARSKTSKLAQVQRTSRFVNTLNTGISMYSIPFIRRDATRLLPTKPVSR